MSGLPNSAKVAAAAGLEKTLDQLFKLDPALSIKLQSIEHKLIQFSFIGPNLDLFFIPHNNGIAVLSQYEGQAACHVKGKPSDFVELMMAEDMASALINGDITVRGDTSSLMALQDIFKDMELDWEYELSKVVGDIAANEIGKAVNKGIALFQKSSSRLVDEIGTQLQSEAGLVANRENIQQFCNDVDSLASRVDRLAQKISRLTP